MKKEKEEEVLKQYLAKNGLKLTKQRKLVLDAFISHEKHVSAEELYRETYSHEPSIGLATIYRTLGLLSKCGLAQARHFGDGQTRYEHTYGHKHHDHLICLKCGDILEFHNQKIESLQVEVTKEHNFEVLSHKLEIYGLCSKCR